MVRPEIFPSFNAALQYAVRCAIDEERHGANPPDVIIPTLMVLLMVVVLVVVVVVVDDDDDTFLLLGFVVSLGFGIFVPCCAAITKAKKQKKIPSFLDPSQTEDRQTLLRVWELGHEFEHA